MSDAHSAQHLTPEPSSDPQPNAYATLFKRAFRSDVSHGTILPDEQTACDVENIHGGSEPLKRLLLWRRGALFAALVFLLPATLVHFIRDIIGISESGANTLSSLYLMISFANIGLCIGVVVAFRKWDHLRSSQRILFWTWVIAFVVPFLVALFPLRSFARDQGLFGMQEVGAGVLGAMNAVIGLAPKALSLVPGLLRAALTAKALFPGSSTPGWLILLGTPYYILLLFVVMLMPYQIAGGGLMALALFCFLGAPLFLIRSGRVLARPSESEQALATIRQTRLATMILNGAGGFFLFVGLIDLVSTMKLNPLDAIVPILGIIANVLVLAIIGVDTTVGALTRAHVSHETPEQTAARERFNASMEEFIAARNAHQPAAVPASPPSHIDYDQPTQPGL